MPLDAQNWTRWLVRPGASFGARGLFRDGPKHTSSGSYSRILVFIKARSLRFARSLTFSSPEKMQSIRMYRPDFFDWMHQSRLTRSKPFISSWKVIAPVLSSCVVIAAYFFFFSRSIERKIPSISSWSGGGGGGGKSELGAASGIDGDGMKCHSPPTFCTAC